jgi:hypothetical protein
MKLQTAIINSKDVRSDQKMDTLKQPSIFIKIFNAPNLLGVFAGHIHQNSIEIIKGKPQIVSDDNANGGYLDIDFLKLEENHLNKI